MASPSVGIIGSHAPRMMGRCARVVELAEDARKDAVGMAEAITFMCAVQKVQTLVDHGVRVTLDLPETAIMQAAMLMECKRMGVVLDVTALPVVQNQQSADTPDGKKGRPEKLSLRGS